MENTVQIPPVLIGRHDECATLKECMASNRSEFVIVCGRRRIGKTFLVDQFFENRYDFSFVGKHKTKTQTQLNYFAKAIQKYSGQKQKTYADWYDAFDALEYYLETLPVNRKKIIFIDEMPWIDTQRSTFVSALENFWNGWANRRYDIVLIYGLTKREISKATKLNGTFLNTVLNNLELCDFIENFELFGKKNTLVYRLVDFYTLFYFKFIANRHNKDTEWWSHNLDDAGIRAWMGLTFELICMKHHKQIKKALGISGIGTSVSTWKCLPDTENEIPGAQIDMLIERSDKVIHLCEMKFSEQEYSITNEYEMRLRKRMGIFKERTKTKEAVVHTFVTTFGVGQGKHSSIVHSEVTMDDLFNS